ncbi:MAG: vancomycin resistance protein [Anaerocolumna sp.]|jgi:vancomycin resistance protein VanW|nr:vancomycin resistance protein [Anaerocolumna sp.]
MINQLKPKKRSRVRLLIGKKYYTTKRYLWWCFSNLKFSKVTKGIEYMDYPYIYYKDTTPLLRQLKDVDMYLQYNKINNLKLAIQKLNYIVINPGETFSYWKLIGKPTKKKGYTYGMILFAGSFKPGIGGGLCQLSNLIYWLSIHSPLTIKERYRHSFDVFPDSNRIRPFGSGATCVYNYRDLIIKNDTNIPFQFSFELTDAELIGYLNSSVSPTYTYKVYEKDHHIDMEHWGGYSRHNILFRKVYDINDIEVADEYLTENHALMMYNPYLPGN